MPIIIPLEKVPQLRVIKTQLSEREFQRISMHPRHKPRQVIITTEIPRESAGIRKRRR